MNLLTGAVVSNHYLANIKTIKPLGFALSARFATLCAPLLMSKGRDVKNTEDRVNAALSLQQMANDMDSLQPSLAAELRAFASRS
jgi:hypothetical protein